MGIGFSTPENVDDSDTEIVYSRFEPCSNMSQPESNRNDDILQAQPTPLPHPDYIDTDAVTTCLPKVRSITKEQLLTIKEQLDIYEKISLVFLLATNNEETALMIMIKLLKHENDFIEFMSTFLQQHKKNKDKLIEALCVIQNYEVLKMLGYNKEQLKAAYYPLSYSVAIHIDKIRKILFRIAENMTEEETEKLLRAISTDMKKQYSHIELPKFDYMEIYFIYLFKQNYVTNDDLSNLSKHFKALEMDYYAGLLKSSQLRESYITPTYSVSNSPVDSSTILNTDQTTANVNDVVGKSGQRKKDFDHNDVYVMNETSPGVCLIIENVNFYEDFDKRFEKEVITHEIALEKRDGSEYDSSRLKQLFLRFGFRVIHRKDLTHVEMLDAIQEVAHNEIAEADSSLVLIMLSHGLRNKIVGANCVSLNVDEIKKGINSKRLEGKPKILVFQACQGCRIMTIPQDDDITTDGPTLSISQQPCERHIIELWATVPGYTSFRSRNKGSWMIQNLCLILETYPEESISDIFTRVQNKIGTQEWNQTIDGRTVTNVMVTTYVSTLDKKIFFPRLKPANEGNN